jgi:hypothetical protein
MKLTTKGLTEGGRPKHAKHPQIYTPNSKIHQYPKASN